MEFKENIKYRMNERNVWYLGMDGAEHLFGELESINSLAVYPLRGEEIKLTGEMNFQTERESCHILDPKTPAGPTFDGRFLGDTPFLQMIEKIPEKERLETRL